MWMSKNLSKITGYIEREIVEVKRKTWVDEQYSEGQLQALYSVKSYIKILDSEEKKEIYKEGLYDISVEKYKKRKQEKEEILKAIEKREKELQEEKRLRELAENDEVIKDLVEQYYGDDK